MADSSIWKEVIQTTAKAFSLSAEQTQALLGKDIANLIAALPFIAGCGHPGRTACAHVGTYLLSFKAGAYFNADAGDNLGIYDRLSLVYGFQGGNPGLIRKGMALLALNMLADYKRDQASDAQKGKYNPLNAGAFVYETEKAKLEADIDAVVSPDIDAILTKEVAVQVWWQS